jgi:arylsulfatase A-like enzyme
MRERLRHALRAALLVALLGGCAPQDADERPAGIVLIIVDTLRPDVLGAYGAPDRVSPHMDRIAAEGARFVQVVAPAPWTVPSISSLLTSRYPSEHGEGAQAFAPLATPPPTLAELLRDAGYRTAAFVESDMPLYHRGFETLEMPAADMDTRIAHPEWNSAAMTFARAVAWLKETGERPFFLLVHTCEVHDYFIAKAYQREVARRRDPSYAGPFLSWGVRDTRIDLGTQIMSALLSAGPRDVAFVRGLYAAGVEAVDREVAGLDAALGQLGLRDRTLLTITADHGEGFRPDLHRLHHGGRLHDDLLRVPLLVRWPGHVPRRVVEERVELLDLMPTLLRLTGVPAPAGLRGRRVLVPSRGLPRWNGRLRVRVVPQPAVAEESTYHISEAGLRVESARRQAALYGRDGLKLIRSGERKELYDVERDTDERHDLGAERAADVARLDRQLARKLPGLGGPGAPPRRQVIEQLRALGYLE